MLAIPTAKSASQIRDKRVSTRRHPSRDLLVPARKAASCKVCRSIAVSHDAFPGNGPRSDGSTNTIRWGKPPNVEVLEITIGFPVPTASPHTLVECHEAREAGEYRIAGKDGCRGGA